MRRIYATAAALILAGGASLGAFASEPFDSDAEWNLLNTASVSERISGDLWEAVKEFPDPLRAATDDFMVQGFLVPMLAEAQLSHFILVQDPENCPFCGTGSGYAPVLEVLLAQAVPSQPEFTQIRVQGTLELIEDPQTYQMFRLVDARAVN
ncbi:MAG: hypothetical protein AAGF78_05570 [Pseudomonadota bacterium]